MRRGGPIACSRIPGRSRYLDEPTARSVLAQAADLAAPGSRVAADIIGRSFLESPWTRATVEMMARESAPWRFGTDEPEAFGAAAGWMAAVRRVGDEGASFGRWPYPVLPRGTPGVPNNFLVFASRG